MGRARCGRVRAAQRRGRAARRDDGATFGENSAGMILSQSDVQRWNRDMKPIVVQKYGGSSSVADPAAARARRRARGGDGARWASAWWWWSRRWARPPTSCWRWRARSRRRRRGASSTCCCRRGERISMALLAMALEERGLAAISFTGSQSGILTNDRHSGARIIEVRPVRIEDELERGKVVIVAGFQGVSLQARDHHARARRLGHHRGGAGGGARRRVLRDLLRRRRRLLGRSARRARGASGSTTIGYDEMQELAEHGAKVLNAQAVEWAQARGDRHLRARHREPGRRRRQADARRRRRRTSGAARWRSPERERVTRRAGRARHAAHRSRRSAIALRAAAPGVRALRARRRARLAARRGALRRRRRAAWPRRARSPSSARASARTRRR